MKILKRACMILFLALAVQAAAFGTLRPMQVQAEESNGLVQKGNDYYYFQNSKKLKNKWKTVKVDGVKYRFYFGKNGKAYRAKKLYEDAYNVKLYKIGSKQYGFDSNAHLVAAGTYVNGSYQLYAFSKNGVYNASKTKKLRSNLKTYYETGKVSTGMYKKVISLLGKPLSVDRSSSCSPWNYKDSFTDVVLVYKHFEVQLIQNDRTKEYALDNYFPR